MDPKTILIADDETHILNVLTIKLRNAGYHVLAARDGEEAFRLALEHHPDLIITDFQMPRLSGLELCTRLRGQETTRDIPAVMLTARGFSMTEQDLSRNNIRQVINKPFSPREVLSMVRSFIGEVPEAAAAP
ncbi:MAG TPA: response regulator [Phycisphaerae bacterium]|nr:response regulator [Phycisphaerae bacterium]